MQWAFVLLSVVSLLSGLLSVYMSFNPWNLTLLISGVLTILSGYAWNLGNEMSEQIESDRIRLVAPTSERETEE